MIVENDFVAFLCSFWEMFQSKPIYFIFHILGNPLICDCEMRWYKRWYNDGWQDVDEDHIRDTACTDPSDGKEHNIAEV